MQHLYINLCYSDLKNKTFDGEPENPKLIKLEKILQRLIGHKNSRCIIFIKTREHAKALVNWMKETESLMILNATEFVGQQKGGRYIHQFNKVFLCSKFLSLSL